MAKARYSVGQNVTVRISSAKGVLMLPMVIAATNLPAEGTKGRVSYLVQPAGIEGAKGELTVGESDIFPA